MTYKIVTAALIFLIQLAASCQSQTPSGSNTNNKNETNASTASSSPTARLTEPCAEWDREYALLSAEGKQNIAAYGISRSGDDPTIRVRYFVLAPSLEPDCAARLEMATFINRVPAGMDSQADITFARQHSKEIVKILRAIWDKPPFMFDGGAETERFLTNAGMKDAEIGPFIGHLLETDELHTGLVYTIIVRPLPMLRPTLEKLAEKYEAEGNLANQTFILLGLAQIAPGEDPVVLNKLEQTAHNRELSPEVRKNIAEAVDKLRSGKRLEWDEVDRLGLPLSDG